MLFISQKKLKVAFKFYQARWWWWWKNQCRNNDDFAPYQLPSSNKFKWVFSTKKIFKWQWHPTMMLPIKNSTQKLPVSHFVKDIRIIVIIVSNISHISFPSLPTQWGGWKRATIYLSSKRNCLFNLLNIKRFKKFSIDYANKILQLMHYVENISLK